MSVHTHALVEDVLQWLERGMDIDDHAFVTDIEGDLVTLEDDNGNVSTFRVAFDGRKHTLYLCTN